MLRRSVPRTALACVKAYAVATVLRTRRRRCLKAEVRGLRVVQQTAQAWVVEARAGENWHECVAHTLANGLSGVVKESVYGRFGIRLESEPVVV